MFTARSPWRRTPAPARAIAATLLLAAALVPAAPALVEPAQADGVDTLSVPAGPGAEVHHLALSAGTLTVAEGSGAADTLRELTVSTEGGLAVAPAAGTAAAAPAVPVARSGERTAHADPAADGAGRHDVLVTDAGRVVARLAGAVADGDPLAVSGPWTLAGTAVYDAGGAVVARTVAGQDAALDGHRLVWADTDGTVRVRDLQLPASAKNPRVLVTNACPAGVSLAAGPAAVAVGCPDAAGIDLYDLTGGLVAELPTGAGPAALAAAGPAVSWLEGDTLWTASPAAPTPVSLGAVTAAVRPVMDDGLIAWVDPAGDVRVALGPAQAAGPALVLGSAGRAAFSPDGDGSADHWQFTAWAGKPLAAATLTLTGATGAVVRTLGGTVTGSELALDWDGRGEAGAELPDGVYAWTLAGTALDGSPLTAADAAAAPTGLVTLAAGAPGAFVSLPATSAGHVVQAAWGSAAPRAGVGVRYDVRLRGLRLGGPGRAAVPSTLTGQVVVTRATATAAKLGGSLPTGSAWQVSVRATDSAGHLGPWSPWRTTRIG